MSSSLGAKTIAEGAAKISLPAGQVFYNPVQVFNRDLSVCCINTFLSEYPKPEKVVVVCLIIDSLRRIICHRIKVYKIC
jgi:tRNA G26 N,N-dimethylase Trm1